MEFENILTDALKASVSDAFNTTLSLSPELTEEDFGENFREVMSSIGFTGTIEGTLMFEVSCQGACAIVSKMLGMELEEVDADVCDGVGEVVNMLVGGIKMKVSEAGCKFEIGIPTTVTGHDIQISSNSTELTKMSYNFVCEEIKFSVIFIYKLHEETEDSSKPSEPEKKVNPLDLLNQAVMKSEETKEESSKQEESKPDAADLLSQLVSKTDVSNGETAKLEENSQEDTTEEKKINALDLLNQAVGKSEETKEECSKQEESKPKPEDLLNQLVNSSNSSNAQNVNLEEGAQTGESEDEKPDVSEMPKEKNASSEMSAIEKLDQAMKQFKEIV